MRKDVKFEVLGVLGTLVFHVTLALFPEKIQPYAWLLKYIWTFLAGSLAMLILVRLTESKPKPEPTSPTTSPTTKSEATVTSSGNPTVNVNLAAGHSPTAPATHVTKHIEVEQLPILKRPVALDSDSKLDFAKADSKDALDTMVLPIHFSAINSDPGTEMLNVRASLVFTDTESGNVISRVPHGIWLDGKTADTQDIHFGETKFVMLATIVDGRAKVFSTKSMNLSWDIAGNFSDDIEDHDLPIARYQVQVVLTWWKEKRVFEFELDLTAA
jgi:hypothetical protein